jgi:hypothetical protein
VTATAAPCTGVFKPVVLQLGLPEHGPRPQNDCDQVSLWWCHERLREYLERDEVQRENFQAQRDALESRFLELIEQMEPPGDADSHAAARCLTERCWTEALEFERHWLAELTSDRRA